MTQDPLHDDIAAAAVSNAAQFLKGAKFPATKEELLDIAEKNGADESALEELQYLPENERFASPMDVFRALGDETESL